MISHPDSKVHGANIGPIWGRQDSGGPHVGPMNLAIWASICFQPCQGDFPDIQVLSLYSLPRQQCDCGLTYFWRLQDIRISHDTASNHWSYRWHVWCCRIQCSFVGNYAGKCRASSCQVLNGTEPCCATLKICKSAMNGFWVFLWRISNRPTINVVSHSGQFRWNFIPTMP